MATGPPLTSRFTTSPSAIPDGVARTAGWVTSAALVDVDGDGSNDLVTNSDGAPSFVLLNDGGGNFRELPAALPAKPFGGDTAGTVVRPFDLDGDRYTDLLMAFTKRNPYYQGRWIQLLVNNGDGTFRDETARRLPQADNTQPWVYDIVAGDLNSDGFVDLAIDLPANFATPGVLHTPPFYLNRGDGTFVEMSREAFAEPTYAQLRLIDVDGDGRLDILSAWTSPGEPETYVVSDRVG